MGPSWGKYGSLVRYENGIFFHSVACSSPDPTYSLAAGNYNMLGQPASHGCIRLCVRDAKWIYDNCSVGTTVTINDTAYSAFDKPATIKIPAGQNWDPTDPDVNRLYVNKKIRKMVLTKICQHRFLTKSKQISSYRLKFIMLCNTMKQYDNLIKGEEDKNEEEKESLIWIRNISYLIGVNPHIC